MRPFTTAVAVLLLVPAAAGADVASIKLAVPQSAGAYYQGMSRDGGSIFAIDAPYTDATHTANRTAGLYRSRNGAADFIAAGATTTDPGFAGASQDGARVFYKKQKPLNEYTYVDDLFAWHDGTSSHVSPGTGASDGGPLAANFVATNADGSCVVFQTGEQLSPSDTDADVDIYRRCGDSVTLLSGSAPGGAYASAASRDGNRVIFWTDSPVTSADTDSAMDQYLWADGTITLLSLGPDGGNSPNAHAQFVGASADATHVVFSTAESLVAADTDSATDFYVGSPNGVELLAVPEGGGEGADDAGFGGISADGSHVIFSSKAALVAADVNDNDDVYDRTGGHTVLVPPNPNSTSKATYFVGVSDDGAKIFFKTDRSLSKDDTDPYQDIYEKSSRGTTLISTGPSAAGQAGTARDYAVATDGSTVVFDTDERLVPEDTNSTFNLYARRNGQTFLLDGGGSPGQFIAASPDGQRVVLSSPDVLDPDEFRAMPGNWGLYVATLPAEPAADPAPVGGTQETPVNTAPSVTQATASVPSLTFQLTLPARAAKLRGILRTGLRINLLVNRRASVAVKLLIASTLRKSLHLRTRTIASATTTLDQRGTLRLKIAKRLRSKLSKLRKIKLTVTAQAIDSAGHRQSATRTVTVRR